MSAMHSFTSRRIPCNAFSGVFSSQLKLGNSTHSPTCSPSSSDQVTRYVYLSISLFIISLQTVDSQQNLAYLIGFCLSSVILNIDTRIALPRGLVDSVTCARLPRLPEIFVANLTKRIEADPFRVLPHQFDDIVCRSHGLNSITIGTTRQGRKGIKVNGARLRHITSPFNGTPLFGATVATACYAPCWQFATCRLPPAVLWD